MIHLLLLLSLAQARPLQVKALNGNLLVFKNDQGVVVGKLMTDGKNMQFTAADGTPIMTMGSDRDKCDVQFSPTPVAKPRFHVSVTGGGIYGDFRVDGNITAGTDNSLCDDPSDARSCIAVDPRGSLRLSRDRSPAQNMGLIMLHRKNVSTGKIEEALRIGIEGNGSPFLGIQPGGDFANVRFDKGPGFLRMNLNADTLDEK